MEAKRRAGDDIATRQREANEKRKLESDRQENLESLPQSAAVR